MIKIEKISELKRELHSDNFFTGFGDNKLDVYEKQSAKLVLTIDFENSTIKFGLKPINLDEHPRFTFLIGKIFGLLWKNKEENKYSLRLPNMFNQSIAYLNHDPNEHDYFFSTKDDSEYMQTLFTQEEIDEMPFDTKFFIKEEVK